MVISLKMDYVNNANIHVKHVQVRSIVINVVMML